MPWPSSLPPLLSTLGPRASLQAPDHMSPASRALPLGNHEQGVNKWVSLLLLCAQTEGEHSCWWHVCVLLKILELLVSMQDRRRLDRVRHRHPRTSSRNAKAFVVNT